MLRRQRAIEIVPSSKPLRWGRYDVPQHLAPEASDALGFCAVEGDLDLLDRRHRSTIGAGAFGVSHGSPWVSTGRPWLGRSPSSQVSARGPKGSPMAAQYAAIVAASRV